MSPLNLHTAAVYVAVRNFFLRPIEGVLGSKTYLAKDDGSAQKPRERPLSRSVCHFGVLQVLWCCSQCDFVDGEQVSPTPLG